MAKTTEKKKKAKKAPPKRKNVKRVKLTPSAGHLDQDGQRRLSREHLLEIELLRVKADERRQAAQKLHLKAEQTEFNANLMAKALRHDALACEKQVEQFKDEQALLFNRLGSEYGVDFKKSTYDDETGIILVIENELPKNEQSPSNSG